MASRRGAGRRARWSRCRRRCAVRAGDGRGGLHVSCPDGYMPRAALGALVAPLFVTLFRDGLLPAGARAARWRAAAARSAARRVRPDGGGCAQPGPRARPSRSAGRSRSSTAAARSARSRRCAGSADVNENAKAPAFWNTHPELDHNEICGWGQHGDVTRQVFTLVELRHGFEHERLAPRFDATRAPDRGVRGAGARGAGGGGGPTRPAARPHVRRRLDELLPRARERRGPGSDPRHHRAQGPPGAKLTPWTLDRVLGHVRHRRHARRVEKPWGYEIHWTPEDRPYVGKVLHIDAGKRLSLQVHDEKLESWFLMSGRAKVVWDDGSGELVETELEAGLGYSCSIGQRHRLVGDHRLRRARGLDARDRHHLPARGRLRASRRDRGGARCTRTRVGRPQLTAH